MENKKPSLSVAEILDGVRSIIASTKGEFETQIEAATSANKPKLAQIFTDLLSITDSLGLCCYALDQANLQLTGGKDTSGYTDVRNWEYPRGLMELSKKHHITGDEIFTFAHRVLADVVKTERAFTTDNGTGDIDFIINEIHNDPRIYDETVRRVVNAGEIAAEVLKANKHKTMKDFNDDYTAFFGAAVEYVHAFNINAENGLILLKLQKAKAVTML